MSRIEEGCMAIVVNSACEENIGKIIQVGPYIGKHPMHLTDKSDLWEVNQPMAKRLVVSGKTMYDNKFPESYMQRIGDTDTEKQTDHETEEEIAE